MLKAHNLQKGKLSRGSCDAVRRFEDSEFDSFLTHEWSEEKYIYASAS